MAPEWLEQAKVWLSKANSDLSSARLLIEGPEKYLDTGAYHCQQAAEKALKAWLTANGIVFPKTHVLEALVDLCLTSNPGFEAYRAHAEELTPLATEFRYPGDVFEPTLAQARHMLAISGGLLAYVTTRFETLKADSAGVES